ncbi:MAG: hypothetical protein M1837_000797 [Sclerophora amabilis]|nr:MAG: hypothetical protein M1837_000797 [Sclerophora amabilis]
MVNKKVQPKLEDLVAHDVWVMGKDGKGDDIVISDNNPRQSLWAPWKLFDINYTDIGDYAPPRNVRLSDFMIARVLEDTFSRRELHKNWPAEFGALGTIQRSKANYGAAAKTWDGDTLQYMTFGGYQLHGDKGWRMYNTIRETEDQRTWGMGDTARNQQMERTVRWEDIPDGARGRLRGPMLAYIPNPKKKGPAREKRKGPSRAASVPLPPDWKAINTTRKISTSTPAVQHKKTTSTSTDTPATVLTPTSVPAMTPPIAAMAPAEPTVVPATTATVVATRNRSLSPTEPSASASHRVRTPLPTRSDTPVPTLRMSVPEAILRLEKLEEGTILHKEDIDKYEQTMVETIDNTKANVTKIFDEVKTKALQHLEEQKQSTIESNRVLRKTTDSLVSETKQIRTNLGQEHLLENLFRRHRKD